jgi:peptidoglycan/xylan/chitin deacetylase (PgdA/CDA1 family)
MTIAPGTLKQCAPTVRRWTQQILLCACLLYLPATWCAGLSVLTYHDIAADPSDDDYALSRSMFVAHMDYLQLNGYQPISLAQLQEYRKHPERMPAKAVMLTFDDGLQSYYEFVVPVLKTYHYPSVASVVTGWLDGKNTPPEYYGKLMSWKQLRQISRSPLVEIVSHTHDLHHGVQSNPQGSQEAASVTRQYFPQSKSYENETTYQQRIKIDLQHSVQRLEEELSIKPIAVTWPYGMFDNVLVETANTLGLQYQFSLQSGPTALQDLPQINRIMLMRSTSVEDLANELTYRWMAAEKRRFGVIDLDPFLKAHTLEKQEQLFSELLDRLEPLQLNMVVLSPFSSDHRKAFFPNSELPVGADVLRRTTHLLTSKLGIRHIYLHVPANLPSKNLSPVYTELARLIRFNGVVFDADIKEKSALFIQKLLSTVHTNLQYGVFAASQNAISKVSKNTFASDFVMTTVDPNGSIADNRIRAAQLKGLDAPVYLLSQQRYDIDAIPPTALDQGFQTLDIQHFGIQLNTQPLATVLQKINAPETNSALSEAGG